MLKKTFFSALLLGFSLCISAQKKLELKVKFGQISDQEMAMTSYEKEPDAPAVVLFDKGQFYAYSSAAGFNSGFERHVRIKIFKKEALSKANFEIFYDSKSDEYVSGLKGVCYNLNNGQLEKIELSDDNIHDEILNKRLNVKKIVIPGVREGSIVELKYSIKNGGLQDWYFQDRIPTIWSEYQIDVPYFFSFTPIAQGFTPYSLNDRTTKGSNTILHWIQKDVPSIKPENYMFSIENYLTKMSFHLEGINTQAGYRSLIKEWKEESKELIEDNDFGEIIFSKNNMKEELSSVLNENMQPIDKVQAIYEYIGKNYEASTKYSSLYFTTTVKEFKSKKKGTPTELNLIFLNMLHNAGIQATPVLIRTRDKGSVFTNKAILRRYNRVISHIIVEKDTFFADVSGYPQPLKLLPFNALSGYGVEILGKEKYSEVTPQNKLNSRRFNHANFSLTNDGKLVGTINLSSYGYNAYESRKEYKELGEQKYVNTILKDLVADGKLESSSFENIETLSEKPLKGTVKITTNAYVNKTDDKIYLNPFLSFGEKENPFKAAERLFAIDYGIPKDDYYQLTLTLPEGYKIEETPKSERIQMPDGSIKFEYLISTKDNVLSINTKFNIKKITFNPDEYGYLKQLYTQMLTKMEEQIVLSKVAK